MNENKFYTCKCDVAFKEIFMREENQDLLINLLEKILDIKIINVEYLNLENNVDNIHVRRKHFDLNLKTDMGFIQVEMNAVVNTYLRPRNASYVFNTYSHHTLRGESYNEDTDIIQINLSYGLDYDDYVRVYYLQDDIKNKFIRNLKIYEINMSKYMKFWYNRDKKEIENNIELIMLDLEPKDLQSLSKKDRMVEKYMSELERVNRNPDFIEYMSAEEDNRKIENSLREEAIREGHEIGHKLGLEEGLKEGIEKGIEQGIEQGIEKGIEQGRTNRTIEITKNLLNVGTKIDVISKVTGLSTDEINNIKE